MRETGLLLPPVRRRHRLSFAASVIGHALAIAGIALVKMPVTQGDPHPRAVAPATARFVWIPQPGAAGGGGGGGNHSPRPAERLQRPGRQALAVPAPPPSIESRPLTVEPTPEPALDIPARPMTAGIDLVRGVLESTTAGDSQGPGTGGGAESGAGTGIGDGTGPGLDRGRQGHVGGEARRPGAGVTAPQLLHQVRPAFTTEAVRARVSGVAVLECVVNTDGSVGDVRIVRSLDAQYGLDQQAIDALQRWRFKPGTQAGEPVPVLVRVELAFSLR